MEGMALTVDETKDSILTVLATKFRISFTIKPFCAKRLLLKAS